MISYFHAWPAPIQGHTFRILADIAILYARQSEHHFFPAGSKIQGCRSTLMGLITEIVAMKFHVSLLLAAALLGASSISFAQQVPAPVTRASVRAELIQLERAGYNPALADPNYTESLRAANARIAARKSDAGGSGKEPSEAN